MAFCSLETFSALNVFCSFSKALYNRESLRVTNKGFITDFAWVRFIILPADLDFHKRLADWAHLWERVEVTDGRSSLVEEGATKQTAVNVDLNLRLHWHVLLSIATISIVQNSNQSWINLKLHIISFSFLYDGCDAPVVCKLIPLQSPGSCAVNKQCDFSADTADEEVVR